MLLFSTLLYQKYPKTIEKTEKFCIVCDSKLTNSAQKMGRKEVLKCTKNRNSHWQ